MNPKQSLTDEELIELLEYTEELPETITIDLIPEDFELTDTEIKSVLEFIEKYNIKPGTKSIRTSALYNVYKLCYQNNVTIAKFREVLKQSTLLDQTQTTVRIDYNVIGIDREVIIYCSNKRKRKDINKTLRSRQLDKYLDFIGHYKIKRGKELVNSLYLYNIYKLYVTKHRYTYEDMKRMLDKSFGYKWIRGQKYYLLNVPKEGLLCREDQKNHSES